MIHIDPATLRKYPIIGILIGLVTTAVVCSLLWSGSGEVRELLAQKAPERVSLHDAVSLRGTRWITVSEGEWHCDQTVTTKRRSTVERWFRGPIESTEVPITGTVEGEVLVASFGGAVDCEARVGSVLTGVVGSKEIFTSRAALRRWSRSGYHAALLHVGASPQTALLLVVGMVAVALLGLGFAAYYFMVMIRSRERHSAPLPTMEPIQPS
jgi:hypothetical protein